MTRFFASLAGKLVLAGLVFAVLIFGVSQCQSARNSAGETRLSTSQAGAVSDSAVDAIESVGGSYGRFSQSDQITRENDDAIRNAPGAAAPVDPGVRGVGLDSLCRRAAYRGSEQCVQRAAAAGVAAAGPGSAAPDR